MRLVYLGLGMHELVTQQTVTVGGVLTDGCRRWALRRGNMRSHKHLGLSASEQLTGQLPCALAVDFSSVRQVAQWRATVDFYKQLKEELNTYNTVPDPYC